VRSEAGPQKGQSHRSSENFGTNDMPDWGKLKWTCPEGVTFDVKKDISGGRDSTEFKGVKNGDTTDYKSHRNLYIANPSGSSVAFNVTVSSSK
jgi:hypothetical protein